MGPGGTGWDRVGPGGAGRGGNAVVVASDAATPPGAHESPVTRVTAK